MIYDDYISPEELRLIETLKGKNRMEKDQIIYENERKMQNANTLRYDSTSTETVRAVTE